MCRAATALILLLLPLSFEIAICGMRERQQLKMLYIPHQTGEMDRVALLDLGFPLIQLYK
jgi:hypothetical protein